MKGKRLAKIIFYFFFWFTIYFIFTWIVLPIFTDPQIHRFESYQRLYNWDSRNHAIGDFDQDGKEDLISFTGCAFLSSVDINQIPIGQQCTAPGIYQSIFTPEDETRTIGQKYIYTAEKDLHLSNFRKNVSRRGHHSYLGKNKNENWKIFANSGETLRLRVSEIGRDGLLKEVKEILSSHSIDERLYLFSSYCVLLIQPTLPIIWLLIPIFEPFRSVDQVVLVHESVTLVLITLISYWFWWRSKKRKS